MRIVVVGATGTIGKAVVAALEAGHEVVKVGNRGGDHRVDLASKDSIAALFRETGPFDALISVAGAATFAPLDALSDEDFALALDNKLMGQVNLVRAGRDHVRDGGSITLTGGMLAQHPMPGSATISLANAGLEGFVRAAALEMDRGVRVNLVSPVFVKETMEAMGMDSAGGLSAADTARPYVESVQGERSGEVLDVRDFA
jgi:NAD(P)-dependent dehydrogenase (short-subunit alcohol dehydrogenase family)